MSAVRTSVAPTLFGTNGQTSVSRGLADFQARRPVLVTGAGETLLTLPVEGLDAQRLAEFVTLCAPALPRLIITERRGPAVRLPATTPVALQLAAGTDANSILTLVAEAKLDRALDAKPAGRAAAAAIQLVKLSQGLPAVLAADVAAAARGGSGRKTTPPRGRVAGPRRRWRPSRKSSPSGRRPSRASPTTRFDRSRLQARRRCRSIPARAHASSFSAMRWAAVRSPSLLASPTLPIPFPCACTRPVSPATYSARGDAIAAISSSLRWRGSTISAAASFS